MMKKVLFTLAFSAFTFVSYNGVASAYWPDTSWSGGTGVPVRLIVEKGYYNNNLVHWRDVTNFSVYFQGNTTGDSSTLQIDFTPVTGCTNMGGAPNIVIYHPGSPGSPNPAGRPTSPEGPGGEARNGDCGAVTSIWFQKDWNNGRATYYPDQDVTEYRITVNLRGEDAQNTMTGYAFYVSSPQEPVATFGVTANQEVVFIADKAQGQFSPMFITQQPSCTGEDGTFTSYDYDNFIGSRAQADSSNNWRAMATSLRVLGGGDTPLIGINPGWASGPSSGATNRRGWLDLGGNVYRPQDTASGQQDQIAFTGQPLTKYQFILHEFGRNNFIGLTLPWNGNPFSCPIPSATVGAFDSGNLPDINSGQNVSPNLWVDGWSVNSVAGGTVDWWVEKAINGVPQPNEASGTVPLANGRLATWNPTFPIGLPGQYCYRIGVWGGQWYLNYAPQYSNWQCVNVNTQGQYIVSAIGSDYEKGTGGNATVTYTVTAVVAPCGPTVNNWVSVSEDGFGVRSFPVPTCGPPGPVDVVALQVPGSTLDLQPPGPYGSYRAQLVSPTVGPVVGPVSINVYEAPFARFFGNDVTVCGTGTDNRFAYDNRSAAPATFKGSFSEYASIFRSVNQPQAGGIPNVSYEGLQSSAVSMTWNKLLSSYGYLTAGNCSVSDPSNIRLDTSSLPNTNTINWVTHSAAITYYSDADININGDIKVSGMPASYDSATFNPDTLPIVLIYAKGNINISASVKYINAVLIAEGEINTCAEAASGVAANNRAALSGSCYGKPLKIDGAAIARAVNLQRSGGTRYLADTTSPGWKDNSSGGNAKASEIIEYPWYLHFVNFANLGKDSDGAYKAYYSMPPRL